MKLSINLSFFILALVIFGNKSFSLTNNQIKKLCMKERNKSICIKNLQEKRFNLQKGKFIKIPVIPYRS